MGEASAPIVGEVGGGDMAELWASELDRSRVGNLSALEQITNPSESSL